MIEPNDVLERLWRERGIAILRTDDGSTAVAAMEAAVRGGFRVVEFTLAVPGVYELIAEFARKPELTVVAGTVLTPLQAQHAASAGARVLVSPVLDEAVIAQARELGVVIMPGTHTPTEMVRAHRAGAQLQKLFPAPGTGPSYVQSCLAPLEFLRIVPTNGVDLGNVRAWLQAGSFAVGCAATLFRPDDLADRRFTDIEARAKAMIEAMREVKRDPSPAKHNDPFDG